MYTTGNDGYTQRIIIYDLFCHEGLYKNDGHGSPLVILNCVKQFYTSQKDQKKSSVRIDVCFNDKDAHKVERLKENVKNLNLNLEGVGELIYSVGDYRVEVQKAIKLISELKNGKVFLFIDPYDYKHIKADQIRALLKYKNAEVLLFLPT
mgnify:CR=1 FL=1